MSKQTGYLGNQNLKKVGEKIEFTQEQAEEFLKCASDPKYFIKKYIKIVNVDKGLVPFDMWSFQEDMVDTFHNNRFSIAKMPRQVGKCLQLNTPIRLKNKKTGIIVETTIGEFYEQQSKMSNLRSRDERLD